MRRRAGALLLAGPGLLLGLGVGGCAEPTSRLPSESERSQGTGGTRRPSALRSELGEPCDEESACDSGFCVDGVCCDGACDGACERCDGTLGVCGPGIEARLDDACDGLCAAEGACVPPGEVLCVALIGGSGLELPTHLAALGDGVSVSGRGRDVTFLTADSHYDDARSGEVVFRLWLDAACRYRHHVSATASGLPSLPSAPDAHAARGDHPAAIVSLGERIGEHRITAVTVGPDGHIHLGGQRAAPPTDTPLADTDAARDDAFVAKLTPRGDLLWLLPLDGAGSQTVTALALAQSGAVIASGTFGEELALDGTLLHRSDRLDDAFVLIIAP